LNETEKKKMFVLVKGGLQGATKNAKQLKKGTCKLSICKKSFLESFKLIRRGVADMSYAEAKLLGVEYNKAASEFFRIHKDWIRTDQSKYYQFC